MAPSKTPAILAFDIGTSSLRTALFNLRGQRMRGSVAQESYALRTDTEGAAELDPHALLQAASHALKKTLSFAQKENTRVRAAGTSCFWHSLLGTDRKGNPLTPVFTWADSRCKPDAARLRNALSERAIHKETGCMLRTSFWPAKLRWLKRTQPKLFRSVALWMSPAEWLQWQLTGSATCGTGMATGTGLFDPTAQTWSRRMLEVCGIGEKNLLPLSNQPSSFQEAPWFPAIGDGAASNLGSDATTAGKGAINVGTSAALRVVKENQNLARAPLGLFCYRIDPTRTLIGGAVSNAGNLRAWCIRELRLPGNTDRIEKELTERRLPKHGLSVLPYWTAERAPSWNEDQEGTIEGLTQATTALDILQATTEAVYQRMALIASLIGKADRQAPEWVVSGGILHSPSSLQRLSNIMGCPLTVCEEQEASLRGAAVFALEQLGKKPARLKPGRKFLPEPDAVEAYRKQRLTLRRLEERFHSRFI